MRTETKINENDFFASILAAIDFDQPSRSEIDDFNLFARQYNAAVDLVLSSDNLQKAFDVICEERKSILMIDGGLSETDAESSVRQPDNLRHAVLSAANYGNN